MPQIFNTLHFLTISGPTFISLSFSAALSRYPEDESQPCVVCPPINPASLKQAIMAGASALTTNGKQSDSAFQQGAGLLNLSQSIDVSEKAQLSVVFICPNSASINPNQIGTMAKVGVDSKACGSCPLSLLLIGRTRN